MNDGNVDILQPLPQEYVGFNTLNQRAEKLTEAAPHGFQHPYREYENALVMLAQFLDRPRQEKLMKQLRENIKADPQKVKGQEESPHQPSVRKYLEELAESDAYQALKTVREGKEAKDRYFAGYNGGTAYFNEWTRQDPFLVPFLTAIRSIDPVLTNLPLMYESFGASDEFILSAVTANQQKAFEAAGFNAESPQWKLALLSLLELHSDRHMLDPVLAKIREYGSAEPPTGGIPERIFRVLMLGSKKEGVNPMKLKMSPAQRGRINGTEYYRGYSKRLKENINKIAQQVYPSTETDPALTEKALFVIKAALFLKTADIKSDEALNLKRTILEPLATGNISGSLAAIRTITKE